MAFSEAVVKEAWEKSGGQCECSRRTHRHFYTPCGRLLKFDQRGNVSEGGWEVKEINGFGGDNAANCLILCMECHEAIH
jgi:hypothetical protein